MLNLYLPIDAGESRIRPGKRPGLDKWGAGDQIGSDEQPFVVMCVVASLRQRHASIA